MIRSKASLSVIQIVYYEQYLCNVVGGRSKRFPSNSSVPLIFVFVVVVHDTLLSSIDALLPVLFLTLSFSHLCLNQWLKIFFLFPSSTLVSYSHRFWDALYSKGIFFSPQWHFSQKFYFLYDNRKKISENKRDRDTKGSSRCQEFPLRLTSFPRFLFSPNLFMEGLPSVSHPFHFFSHERLDLSYFPTLLSCVRSRKLFSLLHSICVHVLFFSPVSWDFADNASSCLCYLVMFISWLVTQVSVTSILCSSFPSSNFMPLQVASHSDSVLVSLCSAKKLLFIKHFNRIFSLTEKLQPKEKDWTATTLSNKHERLTKKDSLLVQLNCWKYNEEGISRE